jgi:hypothetical protein
MDPVETVTITKARLEELERAEHWLECLGEAGVDNWDGSDYAVQLYVDRYPEESLD